jgi:hypothetical protein
MFMLFLRDFHIQLNLQSVTFLHTRVLKADKSNVVLMRVSYLLIIQVILLIVVYQKRS